VVPVVSTAAEPAGTLDVAMAHASRLLDTDPGMAVEQAQAILEAVPNHPPAVLLLAVASRRGGDPTAALAILEPLALNQAKWAAAQFELGLALAAVGRGDDAIAALRNTLALKPKHPEAWRVLADHLLATGDSQGGDAAYAKHIQCSTRNPSLLRAGVAMVADDIPQAEHLLKTHLATAPTDVPAIRMLAEVAVRCGRNEDGEKLLQRALDLAPGFSAARYNYATLLHRTNKSARALEEMEHLLASDPRNPSYRNMTAVILSRVGEYQRSSKLYHELLNEYPANAKIWLSYGHVLKTEGRLEDCVAAYRECIDRDPAFGEAYWSLANLKTFRFTPSDLSTMHEKLNDLALDELNRTHFQFALGKASEDDDDYTRSFEHYALGNGLHRASNPYNARQNTARVKHLKKSFNAEFFEQRPGVGCDTAEPIFIVGMPRSGSTLLEQILSSHSAVEGTTELPDIISMAMELREEADTDEIVAYAQVLAGKNSDEYLKLGQQYIERTRIHRKTDRPFFIDKMPNNFLHVGMIHLLLPNAKIIDARRHPLGCCFSNFKQYYAKGQNFSYSLSDVGHFYRDYVELMSHFDEVLPGRIHRVIYEKNVDDTEAEVRKLLDYCGLEFEPACLRFFENQRPVRTASSEQVRQPIYREGIEQWRHYEDWLDPLKDVLGEVLDVYPQVPKFGAGLDG
jgi:tetratricopeptide (TPR) repeat protein